MIDHVKELREIREDFAGLMQVTELAALDHAIAACEQHAALVARLGELDRMVAFLLGEGSIDGRWFGEPKGKSAFWWRRPLRDAWRALARVVAGNGGGE